MTTIMDSLIHY